MIAAFRVSVMLALAAGSILAAEGGDGEYLPLAVGTKWVLRSPQSQTPAVFEVLQRDGAGYRIRSSHPWGSSQWTIEPSNGTMVMTAYGETDQLMPLPNRPLYLDFGRRAGATWSNALGKFTVVSTTAVVKASGVTYRDCIHIRHKAGSATLDFLFARGVGYVQFGDGPSAFVLDASASRLPGADHGAARPPAPVPDAEPPRPGAEPARAGSPRRGPVLFGLTPNRFANEPLTFDVMMRRFQQTVDAGVTFLVANGNWNELEPRKDQYDLGNVRQTISIAEQTHLPVYYSLHGIETIARALPDDLQGRSWADPEMRARALRLIEGLAPILRNNARWFSFGYEVDGYFEKHPGEVNGFVELQRVVAARMKELIPGIRVSTTLTYGAIQELSGRLAALNRQMDFLALTYSPLKPDFTVEDPSVVGPDFARMRQAAAGRSIVLQEIAYPTSDAAHSSQEKQAEFYRRAFDELARNPAPFEAVSFMTLADLSDEATGKFAEFYGMKDSRAFRGAIQSLGMFDGEGRPKRGWEVFRSALGR
jgi:hypothetical protein